MPSGEARVEMVPLGELRSWPGNPKGHDEAALRASIGRFGFVAPPLVDERSGRLVAGHGRVESLCALRDSGAPPPARVRVRKDGEWLVPVVRGVEFDSEDEAAAFLLADNSVAGGWDGALMADFAAQGSGVAALAEGTGFTAEELAGIAARSPVPEVGREFPEFREEDAEGVEVCTCPGCGHGFAVRR